MSQYPVQSRDAVRDGERDEIAACLAPERNGERACRSRGSVTTGIADDARATCRHAKPRRYVGLGVRRRGVLARVTRPTAFIPTCPRVLPDEQLGLPAAAPRAFLPPCLPAYYLHSIIRCFPYTYTYPVSGKDDVFEGTWFNPRTVDRPTARIRFSFDSRRGDGTDL